MSFSPRPTMSSRRRCYKLRLWGIPTIAALLLYLSESYAYAQPPAYSHEQDEDPKLSAGSLDLDQSIEKPRTIYHRPDPHPWMEKPSEAATPTQNEDADPPRVADSRTTCDTLAADDPRIPIVQFTRTISEELGITLPCRVQERDNRRIIESVVSDANLSAFIFLTRRFIATEGAVVWLFAEGANRLRWEASIEPGEAPGLRLARIQRVDIRGQQLSGDSSARIRNLLGLDNVGADRWISDDLVRERLKTLGYSGRWRPVGIGQVELDIRPGRRIRSVTFQGRFPLGEHDLNAQLPADARVGQLSPARCHRKEKRHEDTHHLRKLCRPQDLACRNWEQSVRERIETHVRDRGYLDATVQIELFCGDTPQEGDLQIKIDKGPLYRISTKQIELEGDVEQLPSRLRRQIQREFLPLRISLGKNIIPVALTQSRIESTSERIRERLTDPGRAFGSYFRPGDRPYPSARVETIIPEHTPSDARRPRIPITVKIDLGVPLQTRFIHAGQPGKPRPALAFREAQLLRQLQLFSREESPSQVLAEAESANLRAFYQSRGYLLATVHGRYDNFGSLQRLSFEIDEGPQAKIKDIDVQRHPTIPEELATRLRSSWDENRTLHNRGVFSDTSALEDLGHLTEVFRNAGFPCATASLRVAFWPEGLDTPGAFAMLNANTLVQGGGVPRWPDAFDEAGLRAIHEMGRTEVYLRFEVEPGPRMLTDGDERIHFLAAPPSLVSVDEFESRTTGAWGARRILYDTPLRPRGASPQPQPVNTELQRSTAAAITRKYREAGYPLAETEIRWMIETRPGAPRAVVRELREIADPSAGICNNPDLASQLRASADIHVYEGQRGRFGDTVFRGNFKTRTRTLARELEYAPDDRYALGQLEDSTRNIESLGVSRRLSVTPFAIGCTDPSSKSDECVVHHAIELDESADYFMDLRYGVGSATLNPLYFFVKPTLPNLFGTAWRLSMEGSYGLDLVGQATQFDICDRAQCFERRARANISRPHLPGLQVGVDFGAHYQRRLTPARGELVTINGTARFTWLLPRGRSFYTGYRFQRSNLSEDLVKPVGGTMGTWVNRSRATVRDDTGLLEGGMQLTRVDNPFNPDRGFIANADVALASRWLGGGDWWAKVDLGWQQFIPLPFASRRYQIRYSVRYGQIFPFAALGTHTAPKIWRYYGGGSYDLGIRGIKPETMLADIEEIDLALGPTIIRPRAQGGHIRLLGTVAFQVISVRNLFGGKLAHSVFYDNGYLVQSLAGADLLRDYRHSIGLNLIKFDINLATLALGYAVLLPPNLRVYDDRNGRFIFDVGITF